MRTIWINGRFLSQPLTGVQRYAREITFALSQLEGTDVRIIAPKNAAESVLESRVERVGILTGHVWEQVELPLALARRGGPRLVNLANMAPLAYKNKIVTLHDIAFIRFPLSFSWKFRLLYRFCVPRLLRSSSAIVTVSEFSKREILAEYKDVVSRIEVAPNAVGKSFGPEIGATSGNQRYLLAVSSITAQKNFGRLAAAFKTHFGVSSVRLLVVGSPHRSFAAVEPGAYKPGIEYLGRVSDDRLVELYRGACAFVFPSMYEGFGIPPLEAQACGCPVVASDIDAIRETVGDSALYFDPRDEEDIAQKLRRIIDDKPLRERLIKLGLANVQRFSWTRSATIVSRLYRECHADR